MKAIIYEQKKHPTQPTNHETSWILQYQSREVKSTDNVMGWVGSGDTMQQVKLLFETLKQAEIYAENNKINYEIKPLLESQQCKKSIKSYVDIYKKG